MLSRSEIVLLTIAAMQTACLVHPKPGTNDKCYGACPTAEDRAREAREKQEWKELQVTRIKAAYGTTNPVVTGTVDLTSKGHEAHTYEAQDWAAWLSSYAQDTLCFGLRHVHDATSNQPTHFDVTNFRLFAPDTIRVFQGSPTMAASRVTPVKFDAPFTESRYTSQPDGSMIRRDHYKLDETFEVCFDQASRVLTPQSAYALLQHDVRSADAFEFFWRFGDDSNRATHR